MRFANFVSLLSTSLLFASHPATAMESEIPEAFEAVSVDASDAYDFVKRCVPSLSETSFNRMVRGSGDKNTVINRPVDKTKPYLVVSTGKAFCVRMSDSKYPLIPLSAFGDTIDFPDMSKDETRRIRMDLSRQLAIHGFATALVVNDVGNANQVVYLFASEMPLKMYYHANFLKKGEFTEGNSVANYKTLGTMSVTARGQDPENVKYFFSR